MSERNDDQPDEQLEAPPARWGSLWLLTFGPGIWAIHFLLCYVTAAIWCARVTDRSGQLGNVRLLVALYTLVALIGIGLTGWRGYRQHRYGGGSAPHGSDSPHDRHRFLGYATLLLSGLSFVATVFLALTVVFIRTCE